MYNKICFNVKQNLLQREFMICFNEKQNLIHVSMQNKSCNKTVFLQIQ